MPTPLITELPMLLIIVTNAGLQWQIRQREKRRAAFYHIPLNRTTRRKRKRGG